MSVYKIRWRLTQELQERIRDKGTLPFLPVRIVGLETVMETRSPIDTLVRLIATALIASWCIGFVYMKIGGRQEDYKLGVNKFAQRASLFGSLLAATWIVFRAAPKPISQHVGVSAVTVLCLGALAVLFTCLVVMLSYLDAYWVPLLSPDSIQLVVFKRLGLPLLYGPLYLYWIVIIPLWFILASALSKEL